VDNNSALVFICPYCGFIWYQRIVHLKPAAYRRCVKKRKEKKEEEKTEVHFYTF
jgi:hypothetical protein